MTELADSMTTTRESSRWVYILPTIHLSACLISMAGSVIPDLGFLGIIWVFILLVDLPVSAIFYALVWKHGTIGVVWVVVTGTLYWYWLSRGVEILINRRKNRI
jgi:hypothetical protein